MRLLRKTKGSALQTALFISVIVLLLLTSFITVTYTHVYLSKILARKNQLTHLVDQGVRYVAHADIAYEDSLRVSSLKDNEELVLYKKHWGLYDLLYSKAQINKNSKNRVAFLGGKTLSNERESLYLTDRNAPLVLVGDTEIKGTVSLPERGVKAGNIKGKFYRGESLIDGTINKSRATLSSIPYEKEVHFKDLLNYNSTIGEEVLFGSDNTLKQSFKENTKWLYDQNEIRISDLNLSGNIIIKSDTLIRIDRSAVLKDVLLVAPMVVVQSGFEGVINVVASHSIEIQPNVQLDYPSSLTVVDDLYNTVREDAFLRIGERSKISGSITALTKKESILMDSFVHIERGALIHGELYSQFPIMLRGKVAGSIYTDVFLDNFGGTRYVNHIYNGTIDSTGFPEIFGGILMEGRKLGIVQWVD